MTDIYTSDQCKIIGACGYWFCNYHRRCLLSEPPIFKSTTTYDKFIPQSQSVLRKKRNKGLGSKKEKKIESMLIKKGIPLTILPVTIDNFYLTTYGIFNEINAIPPDFKSFFKSKGSEYFTNEEKTHLIRVSDHWGMYIRYCDWFLKVGEHVERISSFKWTKKYGKGNLRIGIIKYSDLTINNRIIGSASKIERIESRHPI